tara:strand:+ start:638 stop:907 length:270 start_codon:yes stop_codon:yes gene_type:complete
MLKKLKITCNQATTICNKGQYGEATFFDKIKLQIHFIGCKICVIYTTQNIFLTKLYKNKAMADKHIQGSLCMTFQEKEALRKEIKKRYV